MHKPVRLAVVSAVFASLVLAGAPQSWASAASRGAASTRIAFDRGDPTSPGDTFAFTVAANGNREQQLVRTHTCCPGWSPDGRTLAVPRLTSDGRIGTATVRADGSGYVRLPLHDPTLNMGCGTGSWSPDAARLACETWDDSNPRRNGVYLIDSANGGHRTRVTSNPLGGHDIPGAFSPDGTHIAFVRFTPEDTSVGLFTVRTDGTDLRQIDAAGTLLNIGVDWIADQILFTRHVTTDRRGSIWTVHADGTGLREVRVRAQACGAAAADTEGFGCHGARWSPDGRRIVFVASSAASGSDIYTVGADGRGLVQVTRGGTDDDPDWGP